MFLAAAATLLLPAAAAEPTGMPSVRLAQDAFRAACVAICGCVGRGLRHEPFGVWEVGRISQWSNGPVDLLRCLPYACHVGCFIQGPMVPIEFQLCSRRQGK